MRKGAALPGRAPYRRRPETEWAEMRALYVAGATAKALAARFGGTERTIYTHMNTRGCLRKDQAEVACEMDAATLAAEVIRGRSEAAEAPCRALSPDASLGDAARAAATTAITLLREAEPARSYTYARLAGTLEKLARGSVGADGRDPDGTERGRLAALDFLRREGVLGE